MTYALHVTQHPLTSWPDPAEVEGSATVATERSRTCLELEKPARLAATWPVADLNATLLKRPELAAACTEQVALARKLAAALLVECSNAPRMVCYFTLCYSRCMGER